MEFHNGFSGSFLDQLDLEIKNIEDEMNEMKVKLKKLKSYRKEIVDPIELADKVRRYEKRYPDAVVHNLNSLVRVGESFEQWHNRFGRHTNGGKKDLIWSREQYDNLGYTSINYIKWLVDLEDERVKDTEIFKRRNSK